MKMRIALFCAPGDEPGDGSIWPEDFGLRSKSMIQRSGVVEVDFPELPREQTVHAELAILDEMKAKVRADMQVQLDAIENQRAKLLAITDQR